jgi:glyoxylase-like metal-dependent hydrolase (beta-lactamase superfamily II)
MVSAGGTNVTVQIGNEGVLVVNPGAAELADAVLAEIRKIAGDKRIRLIVDTNDDPTHVGANLEVGAGPSPTAQRAAIVAHESSALRIATAGTAGAALPTDVFYRGTREIYFNEEPIEVIHVPSATSDGDVLVFFRKSDVIVAGDVIQDLTYPVIRLEAGGTLDGTIDALNRILEMTVAAWRAQGGTLVIPNRGRIYDESDVADYRDMLTIIRDRVRHALGNGRTLGAVKADGLARDYDGRYAAGAGPASADGFVETAYRSASAAARPSQR